MTKAIAIVSTLVIFAAQSGMAVPTNIVDTTTGTATRNGTIGVSEYVGQSLGINSGFGNVIGSASTMGIDSDDVGNLNVGFQLGATWNDRIVIYIDAISGGFTTTSGFTDTGGGSDSLRKAISGFDGSNRSTLNFATGFEADYAIAMDTGFAGLWRLVDGGSHVFLQNASLSNPNGNQPEVEVLLANLGIANNTVASFDYVATYVSDTGFRSDEYHGVAQQSFTQGQVTHTLAAGDFNTFTTIPEPSTLAFFGLGLVGIVARTLRRKNA